MKKSLFILPLMALAITSCNNTEDLLFDGSAAERLEQGRADAISKLTADGGLWAMEYFANEDEPGYVMLCRFDKNGSVEISANHKWIDNQFKQERSLWDIVSDNGTVLSFNTYNSLFHIFSDPADITGPYQPTNPDLDDKPIDETGFGHEGDYEFQIMSESDPNTVRLLGKKRNYNIYLRKLADNTDEEEYLTQVSNIPTQRFSSKFNELELIDADGKHYRLYGMSTGSPSIYPLDGDEITQTVSANGIFTLDGFRFMKPLEVKRADDSTFEIEKITFAEDGSMNGTNVSDLRCISPLENVISQANVWGIDAESLVGKVKSLYDAANAAIIEQLSTKDVLGVIELTYASVAGKISPQLVTRLGTRICRDYIEYETPINEENGNIIPSDQLHFNIIGGNTTALRYDEQIPQYKALKDYLAGNFTMTVNNVMIPDVITLTDNNDPSSSFKIYLRN